MSNPAVPTALKVLRGNPGKRSLNRAEPIPPGLSGVPDPPDDMNASARAIWIREAPLVYAAGLLTELDLSAWTQYCECAQRYRQLSSAVEKLGDKLMVNSENGKLTHHPLVHQLNAAQTELRKCQALFGIGPANRTGLVAANPAEAEAHNPFLKIGKRNNPGLRLVPRTCPVCKQLKGHADFSEGREECSACEIDAALGQTASG